MLVKQLSQMSATQEYLNIHCHRRWSHGLELLSLDTAEITADAEIGGFYSLGLHPWFMASQDIRQALAKIAARAHDPAMLAIGECGLDKAIETGLAEQLPVFQSQIRLSEQFAKPLIIHCVQAFNELMRCKTANRPAQAWIVHGFRGKPALARQLIRQGFYLSFGKALRNETGYAGQALAAIPIERLFLETDADEASISEIYGLAAKITGLDVKNLQTCILGNFKRVFLHD
ncbi:MAG: TatD family hydrolase [Methylococcales bacterium]|nr:TatD family hydrolase [Methylococcales bacterium]